MIVKEQQRIKRYLVHRLGERARSMKGLTRLIHEYSTWVDPNADGLQRVRGDIKDNKLDKVNSKYEIAYQRFYLYAYLRKHGRPIGGYSHLSYRAIGDMFGGKNHAGIKHGIEMHYQWVEDRDKYYLDIISEIRKYFII